MTDVHDKITRSYNMSKIKAKDTIPELIVRKYLHSKGLRFRLHVSTLPGKPDVVLPKYNSIVFIHGCFWHGHENCKYYVIPKTRKEWWIKKISKTIKNDEDNLNKLKTMGWNVFIIWECGLKNNKEKILEKLYWDIICQK